MIDHRILLEKLRNFDMPEWVRLWIEDFLLTDWHPMSQVLSRLLLRVG